MVLPLQIVMTSQLPACESKTSSSSYPVGDDSKMNASEGLSATELMYRQSIIGHGGTGPKT